MKYLISSALDLRYVDHFSCVLSFLHISNCTLISFFLRNSCVIRPNVRDTCDIKLKISHIFSFNPLSNNLGSAASQNCDKHFLQESSYSFKAFQEFEVTASNVQFASNLHDVIVDSQTFSNKKHKSCELILLLASELNELYFSALQRCDLLL